MNSTRSYTMTTRARSVEQTRTRILDATFALHSERLAGDIALDDIAARAGVSVQTVLRHFGNREGLTRATVEHASTQVVDERRAPVGDVPEAVRVIVEHYERRGDGVLVLLAQDASEGFVREITDRGRRMHRDWVAEVFAPHLADDHSPDEDLLDLLVVATDVYTWKLLRRDRGLTRAATEARTLRLVEAILRPQPA